MCVCVSFGDRDKGEKKKERGGGLKEREGEREGRETTKTLGSKVLLSFLTLAKIWNEFRL